MSLLNLNLAHGVDDPTKWSEKYTILNLKLNLRSDHLNHDTFMFSMQSFPSTDSKPGPLQSNKNESMKIQIFQEARILWKLLDLIIELLKCKQLLEKHN